jgi:hypothetical protein
MLAGAADDATPHENARLLRRRDVVLALPDDEECRRSR